MQELLQKSIDVAKTILPYVTGGLGGAILTYILNQRINKRKQPQLDVGLKRTRFSLPPNDKLGSLQVSYKGKEYKQLALLELSVSNHSSRTVIETPFLILFDRDPEIVDQSIVNWPISKTSDFLKVESDEYAYMFNGGLLKPGDSSELMLLIAADASPSWDWRGDDDVLLPSPGSPTKSALDSEIKLYIFGFATYVLAGGIPFFSGFMKALVIVMGANHLTRLVKNYLIWLDNRAKVTHVQIDGSNNSIQIDPPF